MKLGGVMLGSSDSKVLGEFYAKFLGKPGWQQGDWYGFSTDGVNLMIGSHSDVKGKNQVPAQIMIMFSSEDVKADFDKIKAIGAEVIAEPYQPNKEEGEMWLATFADPDGNYFQLATPWKG